MSSEADVSIEVATNQELTIDVGVSEKCNDNTEDNQTKRKNVDSESISIYNYFNTLSWGNTIAGLNHPSEYEPKNDFEFKENSLNLKKKDPFNNLNSNTYDRNNWDRCGAVLIRDRIGIIDDINENLIKVRFQVEEEVEEEYDEEEELIEKKVTTGKYFLMFSYKRTDSKRRRC